MNKTKYRVNFFLLVFFHLFLFIYPTLEKAVHLHQHDEPGKKYIHAEKTSIGIPDEDCPVCEFQFLPFVKNELRKTTGRLTGYSVVQAPSTAESRVSLFRYFLLRAPPVSAPALF